MLSQLLNQADKLFRNPNKENDENACTINFSLERFARGWSFHVVGAWAKWLNVGFKYDFGLYKYPEGAVKAFLDYVKENGIDVRALMEKR